MSPRNRINNTVIPVSQVFLLANLVSNIYHQEGSLIKKIVLRIFYTDSIGRWKEPSGKIIWQLINSGGIAGKRLRMRMQFASDVSNIRDSLGRTSSRDIVESCSGKWIRGDSMDARRAWGESRDELQIPLH